MNLSDCIINDLKPLKSSSKCRELQILFNQFTYSHIPVKNERYLRRMYV